MSGQLALDGLICCADIAICGAFLAVLLKLRVSKSSAGLSLQSLVALVGARWLHLATHVLGLHYRPIVIPFVPYVLLDVANAVLGIACLALVHQRYYNTYDAEKDNFGIQMFDSIGCLPTSGPPRHRPVVGASLLYVAVAVTALFWHFVRQNGQSFMVGYFCSFYEVLFAMALVPQLWMFHQEKRVPPILAWFVVFIALGRVCVLAFWAAFPLVHLWVVPSNRGVQMASESLNLLILSDFLFHWARAKLRGDMDVVLPM